MVQVWKKKNKKNQLEVAVKFIPGSFFGSLQSCLLVILSNDYLWIQSLDDPTCVQPHRISPYSQYLLFSPIQMEMRWNNWLSRQVSLTSGHGADTAVLLHVTNALGRHGRGNSKPRERTQKWTRPSFSELFHDSPNSGQQQAEESNQLCCGKWYSEAARDGSEKG